MEKEVQQEKRQEVWKTEYRRMRRIWALRNNRTELMMLLVLLVGGLIMSLVSPTFLTKGNILNICSQQSTTALMAIGMTLVIITSGIDLSVGTLLGFAGMLAAIELQATGNVAKALVLAYGVALLVGIVNGFLIGYMKLPAFIVTLGTQLICQSMNYVVTDGSSASKFPEAFGFLGKGKLVGDLPFYLVLIILLYLLFILVMTRSRYGRFLYASGSNEEASRISGIGTKKVIMVSYIIYGGHCRAGYDFQAYGLRSHLWQGGRDGCDCRCGHWGSLHAGRKGYALGDGYRSVYCGGASEFPEPLGGQYLLAGNGHWGRHHSSCAHGTALPQKEKLGASGGKPFEHKGNTQEKRRKIK